MASPLYLNKYKKMETTLVKTQTRWSVDPAHCEIAFKVRHLMIAHVKGTFKTFDASIYTNLNDFTTGLILPQYLPVIQNVMNICKVPNFLTC